MGIVNVTPDSFSDGDPALTPARALATCERLLAEGADILDLGGESSRPGADPVDLETELARVLPVLREAVRFGCPVSVDTAKPEVMRAALDLGADIVNDIGALRAPGALEAVAAHPACGVCLMHMRGTPRSMQQRDRLCRCGRRGRRLPRRARRRGRGRGRRARAHRRRPGHRLRQDAGAEPRAAVAPGGAARARRAAAGRLVAQVDAGAARRRVGNGAGRSLAAQRARLDAASVAASLLAVQRGARIVRVHDVAATVAALAVWKAAPEARG